MEGVPVDNKHDILCPAYADDIALLATNPHNLKKKKKCLELYCDASGLSVNKQKTKILIFHKGRLQNSYNTFYYKKEKIEIVKNFCYLGSLVYGVLFYGIEFWGIRYMSEIDAIKAALYKIMLLIPTYCPNYAVRVEVVASPLSGVVLKRTLNWMEKLNRMEAARLPRICMEKLINTSRNSNKMNKHNWFSQLIKQINTLELTDALTERTNLITNISITKKLK